MEIINLGTADGLPPVDWAAVVKTLEARTGPAPDAHNSRTTWLTTLAFAALGPARRSQQPHHPFQVGPSFRGFSGSLIRYGLPSG